VVKGEGERIGWIKSPFGWCRVTTSAKGVRQIQFFNRRPRDGTAACEARLPSDSRRWFAKRSKITVPLDLRGTPFQLKVWKALLKIPPGQTVTYGQVARAIGSPKAARAVGAACRANPIPWLIPCHRVVAANGLGGYSGGGVKRKRAMLKWEGAL